MEKEHARKKITTEMEKVKIRNSKIDRGVSFFVTFHSKLRLVSTIMLNNAHDALPCEILVHYLIFLTKRRKIDDILLIIKNFSPNRSYGWDDVSIV